MNALALHSLWAKFLESHITSIALTCKNSQPGSLLCPLTEATPAPAPLHCCRRVWGLYTGQTEGLHFFALSDNAVNWKDLYLYVFMDRKEKMKALYSWDQPRSSTYPDRRLGDLRDAGPFFQWRSRWLAGVMAETGVHFKKVPLWASLQTSGALVVCMCSVHSFPIFQQRVWIPLSADQAGSKPMQIEITRLTSLAGCYSSAEHWNAMGGCKVVDLLTLHCGAWRFVYVFCIFVYIFK
jgi:hypothetical protein